MIQISKQSLDNRNYMSYIKLPLQYTLYDRDEFVWHTHEDTDEVFMVIEGSIKIEFRDGEVILEEGGNVCCS